eukprot:COSAG05_NODE_196_length_14546_cov_55.423548_11_plen_68_part_00
MKALSKCGAGNPIFTGNYHPLHGSMSWSANLGGETLANEEAMRDSHVLFEKPGTVEFAQILEPLQSV